MNACHALEALQFSAPGPQDLSAQMPVMQARDVLMGPCIPEIALDIRHGADLVL